MPYATIEEFTSVLYDDEGFSKKETKYVKSHVNREISKSYYHQCELRYDHYDCKTKIVDSKFGKN